MKATHSLIAEARDITGTGPARAVRRKLHIPAIIYGPGQPNQPISVDAHAISLEMNKPGFTARVLELTLEGKKYKVLPREVSRHPVTEQVEHIDFYNFGSAKTVKLKVRVRFINQEKSPGIKLGGVLNAVQRTLTVRCSPNDIPEHIDADVASMHIGDSLRLDALTLPAGVTVISKDPKATIATVTGRAKKAESEEAAGGAAA